MNRKEGKRAFFVYAIIFASLFCVPQPSFAQEVPVKDQVVRTKISELATGFATYATNFDTQMKDLRDIITGANPPGPARSVCHQGRTPQPAKAYPQGAWASSSAASGGSVPTEITTPNNAASGYVQAPGYIAVNDSGSLRCLLEEVVEWQKLDLSIQIHGLLKSYISDAQTKQLSGQLSNKISATQLSWAKAGNTVVNNNVITSEPVYNTNASQSLYNVKSRQLDHITAQLSTDPNVPSAVGSLAVCEPWRLDVTADVVQNNRLSVEDPFVSTRARTECPLPNNGNDFGDFSDSFNTPGGGMNMLLTVVSNPAASPLGAASQLNVEAVTRIENQEQAKRDEFANTGARAVVECSGTPEDPYCLDQQYGVAVTPAYQTSRAVSDATTQGDRQVASGDTLDGIASGPAEAQSTRINTEDGGLLGYDETKLATSPNAVSELVREFYDVIEIGYFGIQENTIDWAQGTMLMIYDEMKFNPTKPEVVVTDGDDPDPIEYYGVY